MKEMLPVIARYSIVGDREYQQDLCAYAENGGLLLAVLCDGMGGMEGGEKAAEAGISTMLGLFQSMPPAGIGEAAAWMRAAFEAADVSVASLRGENGSPMNAGSTAIAVMIEEGRMQWGCVGDSRIYLMRGGVLSTVTRMHNYNLRLDEMLREGVISPEEMERESVRGEALISFLGIGGLPLADTGTEPLPLYPEDVIILCSDGLYKSLDDQQIQAIIEESGGNVELMAKRLADHALRLATGKQDNTTVMAVRILSGSQ